MSSSPVFYLLKPERVESASTARSWLGRIVQNHAAPDASFTPTDPLKLLLNFPVTESKIDNASAFVENATNAQLELELTGLASTFRDRGKGSGVKISTASIKYLRLQNHLKVLEALGKDAEVKEDLAKMIKPGGEPAYIIVGMLIWENATFTDSSSISKSTGGSIELPVSTTVAAVTGVVIPDINPGVANETETTQRRELSGFSQGSGIFALEYRTIRRRAYSVLRNFTPRLGGYGGRIEKDRVFGEHPEHKIGDEVVVQECPVEIDDEEISWADLAEDELVVESVGNVMLAFEAQV